MSRATLIGRVKAALGAAHETPHTRTRAVSERLARPPRHPRPAFAHLDGPEREARLVQCLESQGATVTSVDGLADLPSAVEALIGRLNPAIRFAIGDEARFAALAWPPSLRPGRWSPDQTLGDGAAALTHAWGAAAETGTLIMVSSAGNPASLAFLPEVHIVALARADIAASFEEAFTRLASDVGSDRFPRAVNLISSPSRTSDIGGRSVRGAHGPRRLAVVIYGKN